VQRLSIALQDLKKTLLHYPLWRHLGYLEVKQRYRRSVLGPWWITLSLAIFVLMMGIVFSRLFHQQISEYLPFFTAGFLFWTFISSSVTESTELFRLNVGFIKQINLPYNIYIFKFLTKQIIFLLHNFIVYVVVCFCFKLNPGWNFFLIIPGFSLLLLNVYWISLFTGIICARFRDFVSIINTCVQIAFFVTPISWMPKLLEQNPGVLKFNPLAYLLDIVRSPLLGGEPSFASWYVSSGLALVGCCATLILFARTRARIAFWVD